KSSMTRGLQAENVRCCLKAQTPATYLPCRWMVGTFHEILDSSSGNSARIKSMTDLSVLAFVESTEAKYSSTELNLGGFRFWLLLGFIPMRMLGTRGTARQGRIGWT